MSLHGALGDAKSAREQAVWFSVREGAEHLALSLREALKVGLGHGYWKRQPSDMVSPEGVLI
ncbi:MAG TPA: hypothetical protein VFG16_25775 [Streptomyces sp.]|nr:hypothetical protein [Streptomyces sp.]